MRIEELQRLLGGMEQESATLRATIRNREDELQELRRFREEGHKGEQRSAGLHERIAEKENSSVASRGAVTGFVSFRAEQLEKEVAILKEKIHHLDDMLKSQQRKVRHMIEQVRSAPTPRRLVFGSVHWLTLLFARLPAPELPHGDPGARPSDQRAGGESSVPGG